METLVLDGRRYVKASKAASNLGYTSDYVGQLCRSGQVKAHLVGRTWYVDEEELSTHRVEKKRMSRVKAREHAKKTLAQYRAEPRTAPQKTYEKVAIRYETDDESLIPEPRKLSIESERTTVAVRKTTKSSPAPEPAYEVENPGEKIIMSGKLDVVDLNDGDALPDEHTVLMKARLNRKVPSPATEARATQPLVDESEYEPEDEDVVAAETATSGQSETPATRKSFAERLMMNDVDVANAEAVSEQGDMPTLAGAAPVSFMPSSVRAVDEERRVGVLSPIFGILIPLLLALGSVVLEQTVTYDAGASDGDTYKKVYTVDAREVLSTIRSKI